MSTKSVQKVVSISTLYSYLILDFYSQAEVVRLCLFNKYKYSSETFISWVSLWKLLFLKNGQVKTLPHSEELIKVEKITGYYSSSCLIFYYKTYKFWQEGQITVYTKDLKKALLKIRTPIEKSQRTLFFG